MQAIWPSGRYYNYEESEAKVEQNEPWQGSVVLIVANSEFNF